MIPESVISQNPDCAVCHVQKKNDNAWWEASVDDRGRLVIDKMQRPITRGKSYVCGERDLIKLVQHYMNERGNRHVADGRQAAESEQAKE